MSESNKLFIPNALRVLVGKELDIATDMDGSVWDYDYSFGLSDYVYQFDPSSIGFSMLKAIALANSDELKLAFASFFRTWLDALCVTSLRSAFSIKTKEDFRRDIEVIANMIKEMNPSSYSPISFNAINKLYSDENIYYHKDIKSIYTSVLSDNSLLDSFIIYLFRLRGLHIGKEVKIKMFNGEDVYVKLLEKFDNKGKEIDIKFYGALLYKELAKCLEAFYSVSSSALWDRYGRLGDIYSVFHYPIVFPAWFFRVFTDDEYKLAFGRDSSEFGFADKRIIKKLKEDNKSLEAFDLIWLWFMDLFFFNTPRIMATLSGSDERQKLRVDIDAIKKELNESGGEKSYIQAQDFLSVLCQMIAGVSSWIEKEIDGGFKLTGSDEVISLDIKEEFTRKILQRLFLISGYPDEYDLKRESVSVSFYNRWISQDIEKLTIRKALLILCSVIRSYYHSKVSFYNFTLLPYFVSVSFSDRYEVERFIKSGGGSEIEVVRKPFYYKFENLLEMFFTGIFIDESDWLLKDKNPIRRSVIVNNFISGNLLTTTIMHLMNGFRARSSGKSFFDAMSVFDKFLWIFFLVIAMISVVGGLYQLMFNLDHDDKDLVNSYGFLLQRLQSLLVRLVLNSHDVYRLSVETIVDKNSGYFDFIDNVKVEDFGIEFMDYEMFVRMDDLLFNGMTIKKK